MSKKWNTDRDRILEIAGIEPDEQLTEAQVDLRKKIKGIMDDTSKSQDQRVEDIIKAIESIRD